MGAFQNAFTLSGSGTINTAALLADLIAGLSSFSITRIGPEYNTLTKTITLIAGDDYLVVNNRSIIFNVNLPGVDLTTSSVVFMGSSVNTTAILGTVELIDTATATPKLRLSWTKEQTRNKDGQRLSWGVALIDVNDKVQSIIGGPLIIKAPLVSSTIIDAAITP